MNWFDWVAIALFTIATGYLLWRTLPLGNLIGTDSGHRTRRLILRRGMWAAGWWQESVALVLIAGGTWGTSAALVLSGLYLMWTSRHLWMFGMVD